jgi:hypothetical protein
MRAPRAMEDDLVQAGLLARGSSPFAAFPDFDEQSPVALRERLAADSCGGSSGFDWRPKGPNAPDSLLAAQLEQRT